MNKIYMPFEKARKLSELLNSIQTEVDYIYQMRCFSYEEIANVEKQLDNYEVTPDSWLVDAMLLLLTVGVKSDYANLLKLED